MDEDVLSPGEPKDNFSAKIEIFFQKIRTPLSEHTALSMVMDFELFGQLDHVRVKAQNLIRWILKTLPRVLLCTFTDHVNEQLFR